MHQDRVSKRHRVEGFHSMLHFWKIHDFLAYFVEAFKGIAVKPEYRARAIGIGESLSKRGLTCLLPSMQS